MNVIDTDDYAAVGIEVFSFPGGEPHANVPKWRFDTVHIFAKLRTWDDVGKLLVVTNALEHQGVKVFLFAPYFPGLRQDRNPDGLTPLTSSLYGRLLAAAADTVTIVDPHSDLGVRHAAAHFDTFRAIEPVEFLPDLIQEPPSHVLIPDKGAAVRSQAVADLFGAQSLQADKKRDFATGKLEGFVVPFIPETAERILIPDDICDGGGTFVGLLAEIRKQHAVLPVDLYVTHGIFSKGVEALHQFDRIYTTDSFYQPMYTERHPLERVQYVDLLPYYFGGLRP